MTTPIRDYALTHVAAGDGPVVVLVHGSLCDYRYWTPQLRDLRDTYCVHAVSLRHYWPSAIDPRDPVAATTFSVAQHADDLHDFAQNCDFGRVHWVGHSRGARVVLELALRWPDSVDSLTLADPLLASEDDSNATYAQEAALRLAAGDTEGALAGFVDAVNGRDTWRRMIPDFRDMALANAATLQWQAHETVPEVTAERCATLTAPVLLINGAQSPDRYQRSRKQLATWLPQAQAVSISAAAHGMNLARPNAFQNALRQFWPGS